VPLGCFNRVWVILLDILGGEEWPADKVSCLDGLEPSGFDRVATDSMHPLDGLFSGRQVIDTVCLAEDRACFFGGDPGLPLTSVLDKWYAVVAMFVANSNEERFVVAGDEHIMFFMDGDPVFGEDGDGVIIGGITYTHEGSREVIEGIGGGRSVGKNWERQSGGMFTNAGAAIGDSDTFGGGS
jgi:hypothetical protein